MRTEEMKTNNSQASTFPSNSFTRPPRISINNFWGEINKRANDVLRDVGGHTAVSTRSSISKISHRFKTLSKCKFI